MALVAVIEKRDDVRARVARILQTDGFDVTDAADSVSALRMTYEERPDMALVDLDAGGVGGLELIRILRAACDVPIVGLVENADDSAEIVRALDAGADDVITKSCAAVELLARVHAAVRRYQRVATRPSAMRIVETGALTIDRDARSVKKHGVPVSLSNTEYRFLDALASQVGQTAPHRFLLTTVWGEEYLNDVQYLRVYAGYLRQKLEDDPKNPQYLVSEWGVGYRLARLPVETFAPAERAEFSRPPALALAFSR